MKSAAKVVSHLVTDLPHLRTGSSSSSMAKALRSSGAWPVPRAKARDVVPCPRCSAASPRLDDGTFRCAHGHVFRR
ncbi:TFIIB-type zinc finger domain-containing protein [Actinomycetospora termitidis]|uniref:TFIIB-type zinc finger domain-containing protein n=1 Tax=Actinomycetospora termitidis TaxID=3053470 RepID=A0ABT7ME03_9PSEU|nr:TFIIB-type zinc finger domain-containing protein [Actinomycetospora sp. Odt1-22]MDL5158898.1 TFIIB-type zinc finger domain-containing protein [Actinomycetospora sp. Odt1-22]